MTDLIILFAAAMVAGALNAVAGGGSFVSFPALLFTGMGPIAANATNTLALWPGSAASAGAYRRELQFQGGQLVLFSTISLVGGLLGALLLLHIDDAAFDQLIPYLMLLATIVFAISPLLSRLLNSARSGRYGPWRGLGVLALYLAVAIYGGFFGAGLGILTLAVLGLLGLENIHEMNALKTLQATLISTVAVVTFILAGIVAWPQGLVMSAGAILGGYGGAALARRVPARYVRAFVIVVSVSLTTYFFLRP
jgi:hypothetical protein